MGLSCSLAKFSEEEMEVKKGQVILMPISPTEKGRVAGLTPISQ